ncbi:uncharacterized protein PHACADRAFT_214900 [Phanerochaete carnosa HHB-10118-sp]|uniref:Uncharacterized protein n=1 Tax=Phanerochaete carnosa (strain HHB-10118-sp) TaxID=650164 RepID=K5VNE7_PHACS|nr:uncharacterized protein PHACADRAFT_214900 [Phanerochaete carnosa HHB-10118-sp]EKM48220.1 hypothetical protein PHACADRAFT_214900 [Phanerochaete carnosa HHB-10118-sp]
MRTDSDVVLQQLSSQMLNPVALYPAVRERHKPSYHAPGGHLSEEEDDLADALSPGVQPAAGWWVLEPVPTRRSVQRTDETVGDGSVRENGRAHVVSEEEVHAVYVHRRRRSERDREGNKLGGRPADEDWRRVCVSSVGRPLQATA